MRIPLNCAVAPASAPAVTSVVLGATAVVLGVTLILFFLALPLGLAAIGCATAERRRTRQRLGRTAGGVVTAGLVLGRDDLTAANDRVSELESRLAGEQALLDERVTELEQGVSAAGNP